MLSIKHCVVGLSFVKIYSMGHNLLTGVNELFRIAIFQGQLSETRSKFRSVSY